MRRAMVVIALAGVAVVSTQVAVGKDTPAAAFTRNKKLQAKVSIEAKELMLHEIFAELDGQMRDQDLSGLSVKYGTGVSRNQRLSISAKDKPLAEVLDELLKTNKLGYIVISKPGDRYDGWLEITTGGERGYAKGEEPKEVAKSAPATPEEPAVVPEPEPKEEKPRIILDRQKILERVAEGHLELAQLYMDTGKKEKAKKKLEYIIQLYPDTRAGKVAPDLLNQLGN